MRVPTPAEAWTTTKWFAARYRAAIPLFAMAAAKIAYAWTPGVTEDEKNKAMNDAAYIFGFATFASVLTSVSESKKANLISAGALVAGSAPVIVSSITFADPGQFMRDWGPFIIGSSCLVARLLAQEVRNQAALRSSVSDVLSAPEYTGWLKRFMDSTSNPLYTVLPVLAAEGLMRSATYQDNLMIGDIRNSIAGSNNTDAILAILNGSPKTSNFAYAAPFVADAVWAAVSLATTLAAALSASPYLQRYPRMKNSLQIILASEVTGLSLLGTLVGHNHSLAAWVPFVARGLLLGSMAVAAKLRWTAEDYSDELRNRRDLPVSPEPIRAVETANKGIYVAQVLLNDIGPGLLFAIHAMHCGPDSPNSEFNRHVLQLLLAIQCADNFATLIYSNPRALTQWITPAGIHLFLQVAFSGLTYIDATGKIPAPAHTACFVNATASNSTALTLAPNAQNPSTWDLRPLMGIFATLAGFGYKRVMELHALNAQDASGQDQALLPVENDHTTGASRNSVRDHLPIDRRRQVMFIMQDPFNYLGGEVVGVVGVPVESQRHGYSAA